MKYMKMLGLLAVAAAALMAFAATASATTGTTGTKAHGSNPVVVGDTFHAINEGNLILDGNVNITCTESTVHGFVEHAGSSTETLSVELEELTFNNCGKTTVIVIDPGTLEVHTDTSTVNNSNGTVTSNEALVTILTHNILGTIHCEYETKPTDIGTLDGSTTTGSTATMTIKAPIPVRPTPGFGCGESAEWTANYQITTPMYLDID